MFKKLLKTLLLLLIANAGLKAQCPTFTAGPDQTICLGTDINLAATLPSSFVGEWVKGNPGIFGFGADPGTITDAASPTTTVTNLDEAGEQLFIWTLDDGQSCQIRDTMILYVQEPVTSANAGSNVEVCAGGTATLAAGNLSTGDVGTWSKMVGVNSGNTSFTDPNDKNTTVLGFFANGNDTLRWTVTNALCGGSEYDDMIVMVSSAPSTALAGNDQQVCQGDTVQLLGSIATSGTPKWTLPSGSGAYFLPDGNNDTVNLAAGNAGGDVKVAFQISVGTTATALNACLSVDTVVVSFGPSKADAGNNQSVCGSTATMAATPAAAGETGLWTIVKQTGTDEVITNPASANTTITSITSDTLTLRWTLTGGICTDFDEVTIYKLGDVPSVAVAGTSVTGCAGDTVMLIGSTPTSGTPEWTRVGAGFLGGFNLPFLPDGDNDTISVRMRTAGNYKLYYTIAVGGATSGSCISRDSLEIFVNPVPNANGGANQSSCLGLSTYTVTGNAVSGTTGAWAIVSGSGTLTKSDSVTSVLSNVSQGVTTLSWTLDNGSCTDTDIVTITNQSPSTANAGSDISACAGETIQLIGSTATVGTPSWENAYPPARIGGLFGFGGILPPSVSFDPNGNNDTVSLKIDTTGTFILYYSISSGNGEGCTSLDSLVINSDCVVGISENESFAGTLSVHPNPASEFVTISLEDGQSSNAIISILSMDGRSVYSEGLGVIAAFNKVIDISSLSSGVYVLQVLKGNFIATSKLIIQ